MPGRVTSSHGGGRVDILLSLIGACPAGGVGDFYHMSPSRSLYAVPCIVLDQDFNFRCT